MKVLPGTFDDEVKPVVFTFRDCELDEARRQLRRAGAIVETEPQVLNLLFELVRHRHRVVARAELRASLWPAQRISESAINACISRARAAVGEHKGTDPIIKTFSRFGYRFLADVEVRDAATSDRRSVAVRSLPLSSRLQGRAAELDWFRRVLSDARGPRIVFVSGNAGIGKTRLIEEVLRDPARAVSTALWARCDESDAPPPFWPWAQIIRAYTVAHPDEVTRPAFGSDVGDLARLVPSLLDRNAASSSAAPPDPEQARLRIYSAMAAFLARAASLHPIVIVLDDIQWIDAPSLLMLRGVARDLATADLRVIGLFRDEELRSSQGLAALVGSLERDRACEHLKLGGIDSGSLQALLHSAGGDELDAAAMTVIDEVSDGNPLIALETLRAMANQPAVAIAGAVRDLVRRRLSAVGSDCRRVLSMAAVIGREFSFVNLQRMAAMDDDKLIELLDDARAAGLIGQAATDEQSFRFVHPAFQVVLHHDLNPVRRERLRQLLGG
ncbi:MAG TPA: AAA family ATPase [Terriglobales bacterium]|nr:AAA family ATPase [Terriglobales bacterium]